MDWVRTKLEITCGVATAALGRVGKANPHTRDTQAVRDGRQLDGLSWKLEMSKNILLEKDKYQCFKFNFTLQGSLLLILCLFK